MFRCYSFHIRTVHLYIIKVLFSHQLMHQWVVLENNIKICIKIYIKTTPTCFGVTGVICNTINSPKTSHIQYTRMPSPIYQYMVNLVVTLTIRGGPGVFMNVPVREHLAINHQIFDVAKLPSLTALSLLSCWTHSCPVVGLKIFCLPTFALKSPSNIFIWYFGKWSNTCSNSS